MSPNHGILSCPIEILWKIFLALRPDHESLLRCRVVCRLFKDSIDTDVQIQLGLRLDAWAYDLSDSYTSLNPRISMSEILRKLETHVDAWRSLSWRATRIPLPESTSVEDLAHGYYACVYSLDLDCIMCIQLPSTTMNTEARHYTIEDVGFPIGDIAIDPTQDLMVMLEAYVYHSYPTWLVLRQYR